MSVSFETDDLRYAMRLVRRSPGFAIAAICTLALGIGANTAIFSVVSGVLLRPLPFASPDRLVQLNQNWPQNPAGPVTYRDLDAWRSQSSSFEAMVTYSNLTMNLQDVAEPERVVAVAADRGLFRMLGVPPLTGRTFRDDDPGHVVVVSEGFRKRRLAGDGSPVGRKITLERESYTVIGVMPDGFQFPYRPVLTEVWIPLEISPQYRQMTNARIDFTAGRLKPGVRIEKARDELAVIAKRVEIEYPELRRGLGVRITPLAEVVTGDARRPLEVLLGAVGLVLLVACANVANLLLARAAARTREVAIRAALGASRARLVRQFLTESVLLALGGGLAGLAVATWGSRLLVHAASGRIPRSWEIGLDWRVFVFLLAVSVATGIGFGLAPAMAAARADVQRGLKQADGRGGRGRGRLRDGLVVAEVALAFMLLAGAGLLMRAFFKLVNTGTGLVADNVLTLHLSPATPGRYYEIEERVGRLAGVRAAGCIQYLPLQNWGWTGYFTIEGRANSDPRPLAELRYVTPGYFRALGIPLRKGRLFTNADDRGAPLVVLINETLARQYFPSEDPIGRRTDRGTIAGVVGDVRGAGLDHAPVAEIYYPIAQNVATTRNVGMSLVVSARVPPETLVGAVRAAIREVAPNLAVFQVKTMPRVIADSVADLNLYVWLLGLFAAAALLLAAAGLYGVVSYVVAARTREFGIRLALGADRAELIRLVLGRGARLVGIGIAAGLGGALALTRLLKGLIFGVMASDPATFAAMAMLLMSVALAACVAPARRAAGVDPATTLRYE